MKKPYLNHCLADTAKVVRFTGLMTAREKRIYLMNKDLGEFAELLASFPIIKTETKTQ